MLGITALSQSPIASLGGTNASVAVTGLQLTGSIGASAIQQMQMLVLLVLN